VQLTATDSGGLQNTTSVLLYPRTVNLTFNSTPSGLQLALNSTVTTTPFSHAVIVNSNNSLSAPTPQSLGGVQYAFQAWSDGLAQSHNVVAGSTDATYAATYTAVSADLQIAQTGTLSADKTRITYQITVTNLGPAPASNVRVTDTLPAKVSFIPASSSQGCSGTSTVTCAVGTLNANQATTINIVVGVTKQSGGYVTNSASVGADSPDPNTSNNSSTIQTKAH
jgi:uncharacterized repeat protein (TIGR01451 family)